MRLRVEQLAKHLQGDLLPVYLVAGDEPLQQDEAMDAVRAAAREQGFDERQRFSADTGIDWNALINEAQSMSLFGGRRILELVLGEKRPDKTGSQIIRDLLAQPSPDTLLLIRCSRLDRRKDWNSAWVKALEKVGAVLEIWPVEGKQLQHWLRDRLAGRGLSIHDDALELLIERSEGNLLAAAQEVDKLALLAEGGTVDADTVQQAVGDSSRYTPFDLTDATGRGDARRALRILRTLRAEGVEAPVILWALGRDIRALDALATGGQPPRMPPQRLRALEARARQLPPRQLHRAQALAIRADQAIKGMGPGDPWQFLAGLILRLCGQPLPAILEK
ncbi:DNA polymerase III subunit delta [Alloalcanivorax profundimaris]|uniref:DNA polymerase III subunit delta n=1 Tax=Alloalcanivorax profundimaris TaxID=2735259 RepID=A0ABS0AXD1_9GAMM|nr:DNA polymerase III subunit delta [Alloalcanivorax profundimaris]MBF1800273.1 DNA polymerase III subunit delta [Alloalcanivorax profundimaris]MBF5057940.1 DNA polymerase III subunit delta [Alloalcanivorax profundimaris]MCQ6261175.1 DNA polymerase III subunit delta [Alcanivorax sp. MM125-6]